MQVFNARGADAAIPGSFVRFSAVGTLSHPPRSAPCQLLQSHPDNSARRGVTAPRALRGALVALSLSVLMPSLDTSIANVALPTMARAFGATFQGVQWIVLAYLLAVTTLIVSAGALGDRVGRKRLLLTGIAVFTFASLLCGAAPSLSLLVVARAVQGLGAAVMLSLAVAFVGEAVPDARRGSAMGLLGTMSAIGTTLGPSLGGVLLGHAGWPMIFLVNVPIGIVDLRARDGGAPCGRGAAARCRWALRRTRYCVARGDARRVCTLDDDRPRNVWSPQYRVAGAGDRWGAALRSSDGEGRVATRPPDDASGRERGGRTRRDRAGLDGHDGHAGGRSVLSLAQPRTRAVRASAW